MARRIANTEIVRDSFETMSLKVNEVLYAHSTETITANATYANTGNTNILRNSQLYGTFSANNLVAANSLRGGNVMSSGNLHITSNTIISNVTFISHANSLYTNTQFYTANIHANGSSFVVNTGATSSKIVANTTTIFTYGNNQNFTTNGTWSAFSIIANTTNVNTAINANLHSVTANTITFGNTHTITGNANFNTDTLLVNQVNRSVSIGTASYNGFKFLVSAKKNGSMVIANNVTQNQSAYGLRTILQNFGLQNQDENRTVIGHNNVVNAYSSNNASETDGLRHTIYGVINGVVLSGGAGKVFNAIGINNDLSISNTQSPINIYGINENINLTSTLTGNTDIIRGVNINVNNSIIGETNEVRGYSINYNNFSSVNNYFGVMSTFSSTSPSANVKNAYLYRGNFSGNFSDNSFGLYMTNERDNYLSGSLGIGFIKPAYKFAVNGSSFFQNTVSMANTLTVTGSGTFSNTLSVVGNISGSSNLIINIDASVGGNTSIGGTLSVLRATTLSNTLSIVGSASLSNTLSVVGSGTFSNAVSIVGSASLSNTLSVVGSGTFSNTLSVTGSGTFSNGISVLRSASFSNTISVVGSASLSNTLSVVGSGSFGNTIIVSNDATFNGDLNVDTVKIRSVSNSNIGTSTVTPIRIFSVPHASFSSVKITASMKSSSNSQISEMLVSHNGSASYITVYGTISSPPAADLSQNLLGVYSTAIVGANLEIYVQQTNSSSSVKLLANLF